MNPNYYNQPYPSNSPMMPMPHQGGGYSSSGRMQPPHMPPQMPPNMPPTMPPNMHQGMNPNPSDSNQYTTSPFIKASGNNAVFAELDGIDQVDVKQDADCIDFCCPRCTNNLYNTVYYTGQDGQETKLYELREESDWLTRCCCYKCHAFKMNITNVTSQRNQTSVIMDGNKVFNCGIMFNCCGCGKPELKVEVKSPQGFVLGKALLNYSSFCCACCSSSIEIIDSSNAVKYKVKGNCCCPVGCYYDNVVSRCCSCSYKIIQEEQEVGVIKKKCCNSCKTCCTKATDYNITFPGSATPEEKMLIIIGTILLDYNSYYL